MDMHAETGADGEWLLCHWGFAWDRNTIDLEITFDDGSTTTLHRSKRTTID